MNKFILMLACWAVVGCADLQKVDESVMSGEVAAQVLKVDYPPAQLAVLDNALQAYSRFSDKYGNELKDPAWINASQELRNDFETLVEHYDRVEQILAANFNVYDHATQIELLRYQSMAIDAYESVTLRFLLDDVADYATVVTGIAMKML